MSMQVSNRTADSVTYIAEQAGRGDDLVEAEREGEGLYSALVVVVIMFPLPSCRAVAGAESPSSHGCP